MVNRTSSDCRWLWTLLPCAAVLCLAAWLRGAEYDEQYTLFLTSGVPRPDWPAGAFPAGLAREIQARHSGLAAMAHDLRVTDVHPPLYFWLVAIWRDAVGSSLFAARLLSVLLGLVALGLTGVIARSARVPPVLAMLLTLGCYGFTCTSAVARGFALAQMLLLAGVATLLLGSRIRHFALAGALLGAATLTNYLSLFVAGACLMAAGLQTLWPRRRRQADKVGVTSPPPGDAGGTDEIPFGAIDPRRCPPLSNPPPCWFAAQIGFLVFIPADLWWFLAQRNTRPDQFPPFSLGQSLARLGVRFSGDILGGLPLYVNGMASMAVAAALALLLIWLLGCVVWHWHRIGVRHARLMFGLAALAPPCGLLLLGAIFNNTPIEVRYLTFATPFVGLLLAGVLGWRSASVVLAVQAASIAGLMLAPQTMQPGRAAAQAAAAMVADGIVLLPRGNDGVGVVGAFAIESPATLPLLLIPALATPEQIRARILPWHRVVLALLEQDAASRSASEAMRQALTDPGWREVAREPNVAVYERIRTGG